MEKKILNLVQTILNDLDELQQEFKVRTTQLTLTQFQELKSLHEVMRKEIQDNSTMTFCIFETVTDVQKKTTLLMIVLSSPGLHEVVDTLVSKLKLYVDATKVAHITSYQEQEIKISNKYTRRKNVRVSSLPKQKMKM